MDAARYRPLSVDTAPAPKTSQAAPSLDPAPEVLPSERQLPDRGTASSKRPLWAWKIPSTKDKICRALDEVEASLSEIDPAKAYSTLEKIEKKLDKFSPRVGRSIPEMRVGKIVLEESNPMDDKRYMEAAILRGRLQQLRDRLPTQNRPES